MSDPQISPLAQTRENSHVRTHQNLIIINDTLDNLQEFIGRLNTGEESPVDPNKIPPMPAPSFVEVLVSTPDKLQDINEKLLSQIAKLKDILY